MKIEQGDSSLLLSQTPIPDIFFTEYLSQASGDSIKVYLYLFFLSKYNRDIKINDLAKKLELPLKTIQDSIKYWESVGLLIRKNQGFILANLQEIEINKVYKPKITISQENLNEISENKNRAKAIETINNEFFQGVMSPAWYGDIDLWFKKYNFDEEVMIALFRYCFNKSALHRNYIAAVAESWYKNKIRTFSELDLYFQKEEQVRVISNSIKKKLRLSRNLTVFEEAYIEKWVINYEYNMDIIDIALKRSTAKYNINFEYLDKLISSWHERNFKTPEQINNFIETQKNLPKQKTSSNNSLDSSTKSNKNTSTFTSREYDNLNDFYINVKNNN